MQLSRDVYGQLKESQLFLANPQKLYIDTISGAKEMKMKIYTNNLSEISFKVYEYDDGIKNEIYDLLEDRRLVEVQYVGWFQIQDVNETHDENSTAMYKIITALTLENELVDKFVDNINGVYALYNVSDQEHSLLHIISKYCSWTIGHIDLELLGKWRTFSIDSERIYNLLTTQLAKSFDCIFQFDNFNKTINAYTIDNFGKLTNITISNKNILRQFEKSSNSDNIITKMRVMGGTSTNGVQFDLRAVNPDGSTDLINVDYYKVPYNPETKNGWMSQGLVDALNTYQNALDTYNTQFITNLDLLKQYEADLTVLNAQLTDIKGQIDAQNLVVESIINSHTPSRPPVVGETDYTQYQTALSTITTLNSQKNAKQTEINNKQTQIDGVESNLNNISTNLDKSNYFTVEQLEELDVFITQGDDYVDDTYVATETMTNEEIIDLKLELKSVADKELIRASKPQYTYTTTLSNFITFADGSFSDWVDDFEVGNLITLIFREDYWVTVRIMMIEFDFDNLDDISVTFSDRTRLDDKLVQLAETIAQSSRTSSSFSMNKIPYDSAVRNTSSFLEFKNGMLNATYNKLISSDKEEITFGTFGLRARQFDENINDYSPYQMWLTSNVMMFSDDGFASANSAFGRMIAPDGNTVMGINVDYLIGRVTITENLYVENANSSIVLNKDGATFTNCDITINKGTNSIRLNATDGIKLTKSGVNQFYIDGSGNAVFNGTITGGSMNINNRFIVDSSGNLTANYGTFTNGTFSGSITGGLMNINNKFIVDSLGNLTANNATLNSGTFSGNITSSATITGGTITGATINSSGASYSTTISGGILSTNYINVSQGGSNTTITPVGITVGNSTISSNYISSTQFTGWATTAGQLTRSSSEMYYFAFISTAYNLNANSSSMGLGSSAAYWASVYANNVYNSSGIITSSDERMKNSFVEIDDRYIKMLDELIPYLFKYNEGTSDRFHAGMKAQDVERLLLKNGITTQEFGGLVKEPIYLVKNDDGEYDTTSEIIDYKYFLRYEEFIPIIMKKLKNIEEKLL